MPTAGGFTINTSPIPLQRSGSIQVPLFDAPYSMPGNSSGGKRQMNTQSMWPFYNGPSSSTSLYGGYDVFLAGPLSMVSFQAFGGAGTTTGIMANGYHYATTAVNLNFAVSEQIILHPLLLGGLSQIFPTYPVISSNNKGWLNRDISSAPGQLCGAWINGVLNIFNIVYANNTVWSAPINTPTIIKKGTVPTGFYSLQKFNYTFSVIRSRESNFTFGLLFAFFNSFFQYIWPIQFNATSGNITSNELTLLVTDDANLNNLFTNNGTKYSIQACEYGLLITYANANGPVYFPSQPMQIVLLSYNLDMNNITGSWAPLQLLPQTNNSNKAVMSNKSFFNTIDPNGIYYYDLGVANNIAESLPVGYSANSFGINISIPGIPLLPTNNGIPLQAYCPCSPVAVGGNP